MSEYHFFYGGVFSNFYSNPKHTFVDDGHRWRTSEHAFMARKAKTFGDDATLERIKKARYPGEAKTLGRLVKKYDDKVWEARRVQDMYEVLTQKFAHPDLAQILIDTYPKTIVEAAPKDRIWGIGYSMGEAPKSDPETWGENHLGKVLMRIRDELMATASKRARITDSAFADVTVPPIPDPVDVKTDGVEVQPLTEDPTAS